MKSVKNKVIKFSAAALVVAFITGCGSKVNNLPLTMDEVSSSSITRNDAASVLQKANEAYAELKDFTGTVAIYDSKTGNPEDGDTGESKFYFKKDRKERVEITKSGDNNKVGSLLVYMGGDKVEILLAKPIPILGKKFTLKVTDKKIATSRGLAFNQLDVAAMLGRMAKAGVKTAFLGEGNVAGRKTLMVEGIGTFNGLDSEVTREVVSIDAETMLPIQDEVFVKNKTILKINVNDLKLNVGLKDTIFSVDAEAQR